MSAAQSARPRSAPKSFEAYSDGALSKKAAKLMVFAPPFGPSSYHMEPCRRKKSGHLDGPTTLVSTSTLHLYDVVLFCPFD